jgi:mRNA interferase RelE/StbE
MSYSLRILRRAQKNLARLPKIDFDKVCVKVRVLSQNPYAEGTRKFIGRDGRRLRVGKYRVIYEIDEESKLVTVLDIGHRRDVYRR